MSPRQIARASRHGGFQRGQIGEYDTAIASIAKRADEVYFLKEGNFEADKNTKDEALLDMTAQVLAQGHSQPQLIVLHLMGSHPQACDRTQGKYETFVQSKETSCYLYTMTQTDDLLRKLYDQLRNSGSSFSRWFTFLTTVWPLKSAAKTCNTLPMMINISKISVCLLWSFPATIKRIG